MMELLHEDLDGIVEGVMQELECEEIPGTPRLQLLAQTVGTF